ncbi:PH domain-containing protein [bacterium]|nr:PH domain-containing protein [bacterium]
MTDAATILCDNCERSFPIDPDLAKMPCPFCGDINRTGANPNRAKPSSGTERELRVARPALVRGHPLASLLSGATTLGGGALMVLSLTSTLIPHWAWWIGLIGLAAGGGWLVWIFVLGHRWDRLRITSRRSIDERGIVMRSTSEVLHKHVRNIRITQNFWQRIVGIGDLEIDSAAGDSGADIRITNVPDPDGIKRLIDAERGLGSAGD